MTAEEKLKEWYDKCDPKVGRYVAKVTGITGKISKVPSYSTTGSAGVSVSPEHIDLIANLVVERLNPAPKFLIDERFNTDPNEV